MGSSTDQRRPPCPTWPSLFSLLLIVGCGGGGDSVGPLASLTVIAQTQGGVVDADGYTVQVGTGSSATLGANGSFIITGVQTGAQLVTLGGIAPNCAVTGDNPRTVQIPSGQNASVTFQVVCTALPGGSYRIGIMATDDPNQVVRWEIYSMNSDGSVVRLTNNNFVDWYPVWSPDGQRIAFASDRDGNLEIYVMGQDGSNVVRLTNTATNVADQFPSWSPDGTKIAFVSNRDGDSEIFVMNSDGSNITQLTTNAFGDAHPQFSPDGSKIVFSTNRDAPSTQPPYGKWEIYEMNADGTGVRRVTNDGAVAELPSYYNNGTKILFDSNRAGPNDIYVMNVDGSGIARLTNNLATNYLAVGSPDQTHIMFTSAVSASHAEVYLMNGDGTGASVLTRPTTNVTNVGYSFRK